MEQTTIALGVNAVVIAAAAWSLGGALSALQVTVKTLSEADQKHQKGLDVAHTEIRAHASRLQALEHITKEFPGGSK